MLFCEITADDRMLNAQTSQAQKLSWLALLKYACTAQMRYYVLSYEVDSLCTPISNTLANLVGISCMTSI